MSKLFSIAMLCVSFAFGQTDTLGNTPKANPCQGYIETTIDGATLLQFAESGCSLAQYRLGLAYAQGKGIQQNWQQASLWMDLAAKQGHGPAIPLALAYKRIIERHQTVKSVLPSLYGITNDSLETFWQPRDTLMQQPVRIELGEWPTDGFEQKDQPSDPGQPGSRLVRFYQVLVPTDCSTDLYSWNNSDMYLVQVQLGTKARTKVEDLQPGGVVVAKGKLRQVRVDKSGQAAASQRCKTKAPLAGKITLEIDL